MIFFLIKEQLSNAQVNICTLKLNDSYGMNPFSSYSQCGEDAVLKHILSVIDHGEPGFYVDVGAFHPYTYSNTHSLYLRGWNGINIDPNPHSIELFRTQRTRDINLNFGVGCSASVQSLHMFSDGAVNTFSDRMAQNFVRSGFQYIGSTSIEMRTLNSILEEYLPDDKSVDVLDIDCEGLDTEILHSLDFSRFRPKIILVEAHEFDFCNPFKCSIFSHLIEKGYVVQAKTGPTLMAAYYGQTGQIKFF